MKGKVRFKIITVFLMVAGVNCGDFIDELKSALDKFCNKMDKLQDTVDKISLEQIKTNKKVDQLEEMIEKLGTKLVTVEDLNEVNNNITDAIDKLKNEVKTFTLEKYSGKSCNEAETNGANIANENQTDDHTEAFNHDVQEVEEKGKNICLPIYDLNCLTLFQLFLRLVDMTQKVITQLKLSQPMELLSLLNGEFDLLHLVDPLPLFLPDILLYPNNTRIKRITENRLISCF